VEFDLAESEVKVAQAHARNERYRILLITSVLDPEERRVHVLPNPFGVQGHGVYRTVGRGLRYQCRPT
jgi:hypothetical protein